MARLGTILGTAFGTDLALDLGANARPVVYLSSTGSDANNGLTLATPKLSLAAAYGVVTATYAGYGAIKVTSTEASPISSVVDVLSSSTADVVIQPADGLSSWWMDRAFTYTTTGWTSDGGGIYHRTVSSGGGGPVFCTDMLVNGFPTALAHNTSTPSTPGAGEYGWVTTTLYVHLADSSAVTGHVVKAARASDCLTVSAGKVQLVAGNVRFSNAGNALAASGGIVTLVGGTYGAGGNSGVTASNSALLTAYNVTSGLNTNDGWNLGNNAHFWLYNCRGCYNGDEGISGHENALIDVYDSIFDENQHAGCNSINSVVQNFTRSTFKHNGLGSSGSSQVTCGFSMINTVTGTVVDSLFINNVGPGIYNTSTAGTPPVFVNRTSGLAQGNGFADVG